MVSPLFFASQGNAIARWKTSLGMLLLFSLQLVGKPPAVSAQSTTVAETNSHLCTADLADALAEIKNRPEFARSRWGILVSTLEGNTPLYAHDAEHYFVPASNVKLLTTAAALQALGSSFQIRTSAYRQGNPPNLNSLRVVGKGDPSFSSTQIEDLATQLSRQGVRAIQELVVEDGYLQFPNINPTWEWSDLLFYYGSPVNSLILNENAVVLTLSPTSVGQPVQVSWSDPVAGQQWQLENYVTTTDSENPRPIRLISVFGETTLRLEGELAVDASPRVWGLSVVNPAQYFLDSLQSALLSQGITVSQARISTNPASEEGWVEIAAVNSPPLSELVTGTNQPSNNLYAEALLHSLGRALNTESGVEAMQQSLTALGVNSEGYRLRDGSGLSRHNIVTPSIFVQTLQRMALSPEADTFRASLPVAGVSGTLRGRFLETPVQGNMQAKTGTLTGVSGLSGYLNAANYSPLVFSILINQSDQTATIQRQAMDEMVVRLASLRDCNP